MENCAILSSVTCIINFKKNYFMEKIIKKIENGERLTEDEQLKMLNSSDREKLLKAYTQKHPLCDEAELKMVYMPDRVELVEIYQKKWKLCGDAEYALLMIRCGMW